MCATIISKHRCNLKIHYNGWSKAWDVWSDYSKELFRFNDAYSMSERKAHRLENYTKGDFVDVNPPLMIDYHPGWRYGEILKKHKNSGQIQIQYAYKSKSYKTWSHLDNEQEIQLFMSMTGNDNHDQRFLEQNIHQRVENEMECLWKERNSKFPKLNMNEIVNNKYIIGDWIEILNVLNMEWQKATVMDKECNWISVHLDGYEHRFEDKFHVIRDAKLIKMVCLPSLIVEIEEHEKDDILLQSSIFVEDENEIKDEIFIAEANAKPNPKQLAFERFFFESMTGLVDDEILNVYYFSLISNKIDIELMIYLSLPILVDIYFMSEDHALIFLSKVEMFAEEYEKFEDWFARELNMNEYLSLVIADGILTFKSFQSRITSVDDLLLIIGKNNMSDAQFIMDSFLLKCSISKINASILEEKK